VSSQWNDEIVYAIGGIVRCQNDRLVLPLVLLGISIAAVLADLRKRLVFRLMKWSGQKPVKVPLT